MTTFEPGARLVLTHGLRSKPRARAFRATRPAPIMTEGFDVLVQLVIAAITMEPSHSLNLFPSYSTSVTAAMSGATAIAVAGD